MFLEKPWLVRDPRFAPEKVKGISLCERLWPLLGGAEEDIVLRLSPCLLLEEVEEAEEEDWLL